MRARVVIGANFGDEGKGFMTDYLCAHEGAGMVVRYNGGAQAGHTVVTPTGGRHVFRHFGSGTLCGVSTFLSQFFVCNPLVWARELTELSKLGQIPILYAHPNCLVTTFADMMINQKLEDARGAGRHGSVGAGFNETLTRSKINNLKITMANLWNDAPLEARLIEICGRYAEFRTGAPIVDPGGMIANYIAVCRDFAANVHPLGIAQCPDPVFEGAQGLLLDQDNKVFFPHLTHSHTGMRNIDILCEQAAIAQRTIYYISRSYLTRHGAGPLPGEDPRMAYSDDTNMEHPYQGRLRFAPLDVGGLFKRCKADAASRSFKLVMTHCDQLAPPCAADLYVSGPTRNDVVLPSIRVTAAH